MMVSNNLNNNNNVIITNNHQNMGTNKPGIKIISNNLRKNPNIISVIDDIADPDVRPYNTKASAMPRSDVIEMVHRNVNSLSTTNNIVQAVKTTTIDDPNWDYDHHTRKYDSDDLLLPPYRVYGKKTVDRNKEYQLLPASGFLNVIKGPPPDVEFRSFEYKYHDSVEISNAILLLLSIRRLVMHAYIHGLDIDTLVTVIYMVTLSLTLVLKVAVRYTKKREDACSVHRVLRSLYAILQLLSTSLLAVMVSSVGNDVTGTGALTLASVIDDGVGSSNTTGAVNLTLFHDSNQNSSFTDAPTG